MSIHDETWDKCPKCKQSIKTWHGSYHDSDACQVYKSCHDWIDSFTANLSELSVVENKKYTKEEISIELHDAASKFDTEAIKSKLDNNLEEFYNRAGLAMSLRLAANFLEGVSKS
jgi:hypothetical protein